MYTLDNSEKHQSIASVEGIYEPTVLFSRCAQVVRGENLEPGVPSSISSRGGHGGVSLPCTGLFNLGS